MILKGDDCLKFSCSSIWLSKIVPVTSDVAFYFHDQNTLFTLKNPVVEHFMLKTLAGQLLRYSVQLVIEEVVLS